ncbi:flavodoxin family protein [Desulfopila inferna]|uniref:flavodoxin family protein n=1 Tax=Desulfopila inferna TaxID=468528 RepID=UPI00196332B9|nr:flavodoxin family protein [Desulfopila inferna]MBM9603702.1 flavodoxin family protein [Desulfopila inferna]
MKILGISASPRRDKSSHFLLQQCLDEIEKSSVVLDAPIKTEIIDLSGLRISGCVACGKCNKGVLCSQDDDFQQILPKLADPLLRGIVISTPVYMGSMTSQAKAFLDRTVLFRRNGFLLKNVLGSVLAVGGSRNGGQELTIQGVHAAMMIHDMIIIGDGDHFGGIGWSNHPEGYEHDEVGIKTAHKTGKRMAEVAALLK